MAIPNYQQIMLPLMQSLADKHEYSMSVLTESLAKKFTLTEDEKNAMLPSGKGNIFAGRVGWSKTYLKQAGLLEQPRRACVKITVRGLDLLRTKLKKLDVTMLEQYPEFQAFKARSRLGQRRFDATQSVDIEPEVSTPPAETLEAAAKQLTDALIAEVLDKTVCTTPHYFERIVLDLLLKLGYGGSRQEAAKHLGRSGDEGIDGIISEDRLGLDLIYVQAKRWQSTNKVTRKEIDEFKGALDSKGATKGVFITTSQFNDAAIKASSSKNYRIVLIDGDQLARLMIEHDVGVTTYERIEIKRLDSDYFEEE